MVTGRAYSVPSSGAGSVAGELPGTINKAQLRPLPSVVGGAQGTHSESAARSASERLGGCAPAATALRARGTRSGRCEGGACLARAAPGARARLGEERGAAPAAGRRLDSETRAIFEGDVDSSRPNPLWCLAV